MLLNDYYCHNWWNINKIEIEYRPHNTTPCSVCVRCLLFCWTALIIVSVVFLECCRINVQLELLHFNMEVNFTAVKGLTNLTTITQRLEGLRFNYYREVISLFYLVGTLANLLAFIHLKQKKNCKNTKHSLMLKYVFESFFLLCKINSFLTWGFSLFNLLLANKMFSLEWLPWVNRNAYPNAHQILCSKWNLREEYIPHVWIANSVEIFWIEFGMCFICNGSRKIYCINKTIFLLQTHYKWSH